MAAVDPSRGPVFGPLLAGLVPVLIVLIFRTSASDEALPKGRWELFTLVALMVSLFSAWALTYEFDARAKSYANLDLKGLRSFTIFKVVPVAQAFAIALAVHKISDPDLHGVATAIYLGLFLPWDYILITAPHKGRQKPEIKEAATSYLLTVDLPSFVAFLSLLLVVGRSADQALREGARPFMAGVVGSQAVAALVAVAVRLTPRAVVKWPVLIGVSRWSLGLGAPAIAAWSSYVYGPIWLVALVVVASLVVAAFVFRKGKLGSSPGTESQ